MPTPELYTATTPRAYAEAYSAGKQVAIPDDAPLMGRIIRGRNPEDFEWLAADGRPLVFAMAADGLEKLPGRSLHQALADIALNPEYVAGRIQQGYTYKLAVFETDARPEPATWQHVLGTIANIAPALVQDIAHHSQELQTKPFSFYQKLLKEDINDINLEGKDHPLFLTTERYLALPEQERFASSEPLRRLLSNSFHLGPLFGGQGYTAPTDTSRALREYIIPNAHIASLANIHVLPMTL